MPSKTTAVYDLLKQDVIRLRFRRDEIINEKALAERSARPRCARR